jgi:hypothetical protein
METWIIPRDDASVPRLPPPVRAFKRQRVVPFVSTAEWPEEKLWTVTSLRARARDMRAGGGEPGALRSLRDLSHFLTHAAAWRQLVNTREADSDEQQPVLFVDADAALLPGFTPKALKSEWGRKSARAGVVWLGGGPAVAYMLNAAGARLLMQAALPAELCLEAYVDALRLRHPGAIILGSSSDVFVEQHVQEREQHKRKQQLWGMDFSDRRLQLGALLVLLVLVLMLFRKK